MEFVCNNNICTGCQACKVACPAEAIHIQENEKGFFYPVIDRDKCIDCKKCRKTCPALVTRSDFRQPIKVYGGWSKDKGIRQYSTSGGYAYELSKSVIENGGVVCGCRWNQDHAEHVFADKVEDLKQFQGSKYAYSDVGDCYIQIKDYLNRGTNVLFIGTGCQVAGLKSFLMKDYENLITVDVLCHGIPSQRALRERIDNVEKENGGKKVKEVRFREQREDQLHSYCKYTFEDGEFVCCSVYKDVYFRGFVSNFLLRPNCFNCQYAQEKRISDITLADFWGYYPKKFSFLSYSQGISLALCNTEKGIELFHSLKEIKKEERQYSLAKGSNLNLNTPQQKPRDYESFWTRYMTGENLESLFNEYFPPMSIPPVRKKGWRTYSIILFGESFTSSFGQFAGSIKLFLKSILQR